MAGHTRTPMVVLVHGSPGSPRSWDKVVERLAERRPGVEIVRLALPGWGERNPGPIEPLDFDGIVGRLAAQVDPGDRPVLLVGFSAGSLFTLGLANRVPWALRGLVLFEPMGLAALELIGAAEESAAIRSAFDRYFDAVDQRQPDAIEAVMDVWYQPGFYAALPEPAKQYLRTWAPLNTRDGRAALSHRFTRDHFTGIDVRTITTWGTGGPVVWQHFAEAIAQLVPDAQVRPIPGATHALLDTHPEAVVALIEELLPAS